MTDKHDLRRIALSLPEVTESGDKYEFRRDGRLFAHPYPERVDPKKPRVPRYDQFVLRVASADDKEALLNGEPEVFFTTEHYNGWAGIIVRLDQVNAERLSELLNDAWEAAPTSSKLTRQV